MYDMEGLHIQHISHIGHMYGPPTSQMEAYQYASFLTRVHCAQASSLKEGLASFN